MENIFCPLAKNEVTIIRKRTSLGNQNPIRYICQSSSVSWCPGNAPRCVYFEGNCMTGMATLMRGDGISRKEFVQIAVNMFGAFDYCHGA